MRACAPFNSKDADVVLRSSDSVDFKVHKHTVSLASPVLAALIHHAPRPPPPPSGSRRHRRRPVVSLSEPSEFLEIFLRFVYPVPEPPVTLHDLATLLELAAKYDSPSVVSRVRLHLQRSDFLEADPLQVYALASFARMDDVVRVAARHTLSRPIPPSDKLTDVHLLSGTALVRLLDYRTQCVRAAVKVARISEDAVPWWVQLQWRRLCFLSECGWECTKLPRRSLKWHKTLHERVDVPQYWVDYMNSVGAALRERLDPSVARDPRLVRPAVEQATQCAKCASKAHWDVEEFARILEEAVEEAISSVELGGDCADEYDEDSRALVPTTKTNYLLPCDRVVWPLFDYFFNVYSKRQWLDQPYDDEDDFDCDQDELVSRPPSSDY
ncbi:hypothetical protein C8Q80DRAFT_1267366 [Daedaleopsis nitida]|nr:hypothetical protein C8Q80DRAFT_1267366 [Daedaleopsis nitida]